jgi:phosphoglycolate phosphatase
LKIKGILFDKDGTLIEHDHFWVHLYRAMLMRLKNIAQNEADLLLQIAGYDCVNDRVIGGSAFAGGTTTQLVALWWPEASDARSSSTLIVLSDRSMRMRLPQS